MCRCRTCAFNCKCARVYIVYTVGIWVCGGRGLWVYSVYIWIHVCIWVYRLASDNTCEHLSIQYTYLWTSEYTYRLASENTYEHLSMWKGVATVRGSTGRISASIGKVTRLQFPESPMWWLVHTSWFVRSVPASEKLSDSSHLGHFSFESFRLDGWYAVVYMIRASIRGCYICMEVSRGQQTMNSK